MYRSRCMTIVISHTYFEYQNYPSDSQDIVLRYSSYAFPANFVSLSVKNPAVQYVNVGGVVNFVLNPIWKHVIDDYTTNVVEVCMILIYNTYLDGQAKLFSIDVICYR